MDTKSVKPEFISDDAVAKYKETATYADAFPFQLKELFPIHHPEHAPKGDEMFETENFKSFSENVESCHVYFPWNNTLVHTVTEKDYYLLRTNRNQDLITAEEQEKLFNSHVAVFGLSVGSNIVHTLVQAGIANEITIADFDLLDTTNLNRIPAGVHQIGVEKISVALQRIYEVNPFAKVHAYTEGVTPESLQEIIDSKPDLIIEEVDALPIKVQTRMLAQQHKLPVLMITDNGDGVVLHIERYDLGHDKIFGKDAVFWQELMSKGKPSKEEIANLIVDHIVGGPDKVDPRMMKSVQKVINHELQSWPQLGSAAILAGVVGTIFTKRILLGDQNQKDVRETIFIPEKDLGGHE